MFGSFLQFVINSILFMILWHYGTKAFFYIKEKRYQFDKARIKRKLKAYVDKI